MSTDPDATSTPHEPASSASTFDMVRTTVVLVLGVAALVYALWPPLKPPYLTAAGGLLGIDPVFRAAKR